VVGDVPTSKPDQAIAFGRMAEEEVVVLGQQHQRVLLGVTGDLTIRGLAAEHVANMFGRVPAIFEPAAQGLRQLGVDQQPPQAACTTA
jgi:hypothetical protein